MRKPLLLLLLLPVLLGQAYNVPFNPPAAAAGATQYFSDDFSGTEAKWTDGSGTWAINTGEYQSSVSSGSAIFTDEATDTVTQFACVQNASSATTYAGVKLRINTLDDSGNSYAMRWNLGGTKQITWRKCVEASCDDIGNDYLTTLDEDNWLCAEVEGTLANTIGRFWERASDPTGEDPDDWGDPDACWCNGGSCSGCNCAGSTDCDNAEPGAGNYSDCGSGDCYVGLYSGSNATVLFDNFSGGSW